MNYDSKIKEIEAVSTALIQMDVALADYKLSVKEYDSARLDKAELLDILVGEDSSKMTWDEFKGKLSDYQKGLGFTWKRTQGQSGTLTLSGVSIPKEVGEEIAMKLLENKRTKEGDIKEILKKNLPEMYKYLEGKNAPKSSFDEYRIYISDAKDGFSQC